MTIKKISETVVFGGSHQQFTHMSTAVKCEMRFAIYLPPKALSGEKVPVIYWLSGLTCTDENFMQKAGALRIASALNIAIVAPDTSPRGSEVPNDDGYDLGQGAGFYLNATQAPWSEHFHMYDYVVAELPSIIESHFPVNNKRSISGHSMGGHGALTIALKNASSYQSVSAFSPIVNPMDCPWGQKAFTTYLGTNEDDWLEYDTCKLLDKSKSIIPCMIEQGLSDNFLVEQLKSENLLDVAALNGVELNYQAHEGYDHSYYFISSFIEQHVAFHAAHLNR